MVEFQLGPMDRDHYAEPPVQEDARIEEPIIPIDELGETVVEQDPRTGGHILQNIEASIRRGASQFQLMWSTGSNQAIGGRPKAYGKEVRRAIRELLEANKVEMTGMELPTSTNTNMSGFDMQRGTISEAKRRQDIQEVKDAIDFAVDVAGGGGIDIWSQEFARDITDSDWNRDKKDRFYDYSPEELDYKDQVEKYKRGEGPKPTRNPRIESVKYLYDDRTGQMIQNIRKSSIIHSPIYMTAKEIDETYGTDFTGKKDEKSGRVIKGDDYVDLTGQWLDPKNPEDQIRRVAKWDPEKTRFESEDLHWSDIERMAEEQNKGKKPGEEGWITPEQVAYNLQLDNQILQSRGASLYHTQRYETERNAIISIQREKKRYLDEEVKMKKIFANDPEGLKFWREQKFKELARGSGERLSELQNQYETPASFFDSRIKGLQHSLKHTHEASASADAKADEFEEMKKHVATPEKIALKNTQQSYAELGIYAMEKAKDPNAKKDVYVGPELGWPTAYGGHPREFIEIVKGARKEMVKTLMGRGVREQEAWKAAKKHIKGDFDTSHLAMWYNHFGAKKGESEEARLKRFNKWFLSQVDEMAKADVIGSIQVVDSITGQHSHLPPGQGKFPVVEAVKKLREKYGKNWDIDVVSEGHEEERFGQGRILTETWKSFGSPIGSGYFSGAPGTHTFSGIQQSYFGATQPPTYIVGAYAPSNEWSLWSEVPFE